MVERFLKMKGNLNGRSYGSLQGKVGQGWRYESRLPNPAGTKKLRRSWPKSEENMKGEELGSRSYIRTIRSEVTFEW